MSHLNRQTTYVYTNPAWSEADNAAGAFGNTIAEYPSGGGSIYRTYDKADRVLTVRNLGFDGTILAETAYAYDKLGKTTEVRHTLGEETYSTVNVYDSQARLIKVWERVKDYDGNTLPGSYTILGNVTSYTYSGTPGLVTEIDKKARTDSGMIKVAEYAYDFMGRRTSQTIWVDATNSNVTTYEYDYRGRLTVENPPTSAYTQYDYDNLDRLIETRHYEDDPEGVLLAREGITYDSAGGISARRTINPDDETYEGDTVYSYDLAGRLLQVRDPGVHYTTYDYDTAGRQYSIEDPAGNLTLLRLNAAGETVRMARKNKLDATPTWRIEYVFQYLDDAGRLRLAANWGTNQPDGFVLQEAPADWAAELTPPAPLLASTSNAIRTLYAYDDLGRTVSVTDPDNMTTSTSYDMLSRVATVTEDVGSDTHTNRVTEYDYDQQDAGHVLYETVTAHNDSTPQVTSYYHGDAVDVALVSQITYPDAGEVTFSFNRDGTLASKTDQRDWTISYIRDGLGRVTQESAEATGSTSLEGSNIISYEYDALGRMTDAKDDNGEVDGNADLIPDYSHVTLERYWTDGYTSLTDSQSVNSSDLSMASQWNLDGVRATLLRSVTDFVSFQRDDLHRPTAIHKQGTLYANFEYKGLYLSKCGLYSSIRKVEKLFTDTSDLDGYDAWGRIARVSYRKCIGGNTIVDLQYAYSSASDRTYQKDNVNSSADELYGYGELHRLWCFKRGTLTGLPNDPDISSPNRVQMWSLDTLGNWTNITTWNGAQYARPYEDRAHNNDANQITQINPLPIDQDDPDAYSPVYDNAGNLTSLPATDGSPDHKFVYDFRNRLIKVTDQNDTALVRCYYDGLNRLAKKCLISTPTDDTIYLYDGWRIARMLRYNSTAERWKPYIAYHYGEGYIDEPVIMDKNTSQPLDDTYDVRYFLCQQANYNVVAVADSTGAVVESVKYDPYGQPTLSGTATGNTLLFQGQLWDSDAGLYCFRNRWYSPALGRFMQRDPAAYEGGAGLYVFAAGSPARYLDPYGLWTLEKVLCILCGDEAGKRAVQQMAKYAVYKFAKWTVDTQFYQDRAMRIPDGSPVTYSCHGLHRRPVREIYIEDVSDTEAASIIVHEATHAAQYQQYEDDLRNDPSTKPPTTQEKEQGAAIETERFRQRQGLPPSDPSYVVGGKLNPQAIRSKVNKTYGIGRPQRDFNEKVEGIVGPIQVWRCYTPTPPVYGLSPYNTSEYTYPQQGGFTR